MAEDTSYAIRRAAGKVGGTPASSANDFLRQRGRAPVPEPEPTEQDKARDARDAQLRGLCKAVGVKNVATVAGLVPDSAVSDRDVVRWLDDFSIVCPHLWKDTTALTDKPMSQVIGSANE